ncbi:hypothetical protein [Halobacillus sp. A5]|uniref:hypothetical protein n=1 Tax=Halobacillus sp. A5 TaxID=2880263 RepID=UPI0020A640DB|nr:hypothetical protein [Halobacillus sp. A5]MCP3026619.1 hypothetical protein [Halobacillus sp. A5]
MNNLIYVPIIIYLMGLLVFLASNIVYLIMRRKLKQIKEPSLNQYFLKKERVILFLLLPLQSSYYSYLNELVRKQKLNNIQLRKLKNFYQTLLEANRASIAFDVMFISFFATTTISILIATLQNFFGLVEGFDSETNKDFLTFTFSFMGIIFTLITFYTVSKSANMKKYSVCTSVLENQLNKK